MSPHYNYRNLRIHRNYTYGEISRKLHVSKKTIRNWIVKGLPGRCHIILRLTAWV